MAKGVKKIKYAGGKIYKYLCKPNVSLVIPPEEEITLQIGEWFPGTTDTDKKKDLVWMQLTQDRKYIIKQTPKKTEYKFKLQKKECGVTTYYIEASLSGKSDDKNFTGLYIQGVAPPLIVSSRWSTQKGGASIKNNKKIKWISYGHIVYLNLTTEGLNGKKLIIDIFNRQYFRSDKLIFTYTDVKVVDGEVNLKIQNTFSWMNKVNNIQDVEEFYIKVKDPSTGKYIKDSLGDELHAIYLNIKEKVVTTQVAKSENLTPTTVYKPDVNAERYEPCKFTEIRITDVEKKDGKAEPKSVTVFKDGQKLAKKTTPKDRIERKILFEFDSANLSAEGAGVLNKILKFLLVNPHSTINLSGHACVIGKMEYNRELSQKRAETVKKFLADGKLDPKRIIAVGKGEINPSDDKKGRDNIKYKNEKEYIEARCVYLSFDFYGHDAQTIVYETIAPSVDTKKSLTFDILDFETKACFRDKSKHEKKVTILDVGQEMDKGGVPKPFNPPSFNYNVYSDLSYFNLFPIQYIWPIATTPNNIFMHVHSCRYYSNKQNSTILIKVYPDIKWELIFFLNLTNDLSVKWQNASADKIKELQKNAGKLGAERRWKQKDVSLGFSLKGEWDKNNNGEYTRNNEFTAKYETKFKKLYDIFASIGAMADGITNKTKGQIRNIGMKGLPISFAVKPPNLNFKGIWNLERAKVKNDPIKEIGTKVDISFNADPLIGLEITIDLLCTAVGLVAGAVSGGTAAPGAVRLYGLIKGKMNSGVQFGNDDFGAKFTADVYIDLVISSTIKSSIGFSFNTVSDSSDSEAKLELTNTLKVELKAGVWAKAEANLILVKIEGYFEMSGKGYASVTFGHEVKYNDTGLIYRPQLGFDGLNAEYVIKAKAGLSAKKTAPETNIVKTVEDGNEGIISQGKYSEIIPKFDVIKSLAELFGINADIPLIKN